MTKKSELGQFNTTNKQYILSGFEKYISNKDWVDPYAGNGDLLEWVKDNGADNIEGYDIDPSKTSKTIKLQDTFLKPINLTGKFVIANPPYLARNKSKDKSLYDLYKQDDLYKIAIQTTQSCEGGIFIVPLNFLSSVYANSIRDSFFAHFEILSCKVFEESVFDDTDYTVCAFYFQKRKKASNSIHLSFFPSDYELTLEITEKHHWIIGEEFYRCIDGVDHKGIGRWTVKNGILQEKENGLVGTVFINDFVKETSIKDDIVINGPTHAYFRKDILDDILLIRAIDTGSMDGRIGLYDIRKFTGNKYPVMLGLETSRNLAHVRFKLENRPSVEEQLEIMAYVNKKLEKLREKYRSVFLTAFRNSTAAYSRKRIGFDDMYKLIAHAMTKI